MISRAIESLRPKASWTLIGDSYQALDWHDDTQSKPTESEVESEVLRLKSVDEAIKYKANRAAEYPPVTDYLDAVVKGDQAQIAKYIADCQAVKAKYPKP